MVHRDKGLYYHCNEKWVLDHQCKPRLHFLIIDEDIEIPLYLVEADEPLNPPKSSSTGSLMLSLNTMTGMQAPREFPHA